MVFSVFELRLDPRSDRLKVHGQKQIGVEDKRGKERREHDCSVRDARNSDDEKRGQSHDRWHELPACRGCGFNRTGIAAAKSVLLHEGNGDGSGRRNIRDRRARNHSHSATAHDRDFRRAAARFAA